MESAAGSRTFWSVDADQLLEQLGTSARGLSLSEAARRLERVSHLKPHRASAATLLWDQFKSPIILLLFCSAVLSLTLLDDATNGLIIVFILVASGLLSFWQELSAADAVAKLMRMIETKVTVIREGQDQEVPLDAVVPGDVVRLRAGDLIPGDCRLLTARDLFVNEAVLTGESFPAEKSCDVLPEPTPLGQRVNAVFLGTNVISGLATAVVVGTGPETEFGKISLRLEQKQPETGFERGLRNFGQLLVRIVLVITVVVFVVKVGWQGKEVVDSLIVGLALAVGMTPQLLPAITSVVLAAGAKAMARQQVIVKQLLSIENLGSMTVLCADKTGTLTDGVVRLQDALDLAGRSSEYVARYAFFNASFQTGFANPIDRAIQDHREFDLSGVEKLDEIPYDFARRRLSVRVAEDGQKLLITKGALAQVLECCTQARMGDGALVDLAQQRTAIDRRFAEMSNEGLRVLGLAVRAIDAPHVTKEDERNMTFLGFLVFADPPKADAAETIAQLRDLGVALKVITGDNHAVAATISGRVGIAAPVIVTGSELRTLGAEAFVQRARQADVFAEVEPNQKEQIILALKQSGEVVGYLGDGINDASALHAADVGISVAAAVDVAREAAQIVLLRQDLGVLVRGVREGRRTFSNTLKYVFYVIAANFGYMFSLAVASVFMPFDPLLASQILLVNLLADFPAMALSTDSVDPEQIQRPQRWDVRFIVRFMMSFGFSSSMFDFLTFGAMFYIFRELRAAVPAEEFEKLFHTGWFVESTLTGLMILAVVRTRRPFFMSRPGRLFLIAAVSMAFVAVLLPYSPFAEALGFVKPPVILLVIALVITLLYGAGMELVKWVFYRFLTRHGVKQLVLLLAAMLIVGSAAPASARTAQATADGHKLVYREGGQTMVIQAWGRDSLRVRITPDGGGQTSDWALDIPLESPAQIEISDSVAVIRNGQISARIQDIPAQRGRLQFFRHRGAETECILSEYDYVVHAHNPGTRTFRPVGDGLFHCELHFAARDGERFYGMGENAVGRLDLKGSVIDLYQRHVKAVVPFVVSSEGYGFLWNNPALGRAEFGTNRTRWVAYGSRQLDYYITAGDSYADIMANYADATGHAPPFPYWASGFWQCKLRYQTQDEFLNVAREFQRRGLPLSVLVIDFLHWDVTGNWRLDPKFWPDPQAMVRELDAMGVRIMISPWTLVDEKSENFAYMKAHGLFTGSIGGSHDTVEFGGPKYQYDPTNPEAAAYLWSKWKQNYFDLGIRTFWLDPCDEFHEIADYDQVLFHIGSAKEAHAFFPVAHQKNIFEGLRAAGETEVVTICRNAWAGSQRYGACPAPHDIESSFEHLEEYMKVGLNVMMSGIPWWNCDIGGFITRDNSSPRFQELMVRWYQYGVFLPVFRTHGCRPNNEPWNIGGDTYPLIRSALLLRQRLRGYVMEQMRLASERGLPPMRPLFFDFADDPQAAAVEDQFLFGPDLLVAPVTKFGMRQRAVYLPAGTPWTDAWTGNVFSGGQVIQADAPLECIPVFIRDHKPELLQLFRTLEFFSFNFGDLGPATIVDGEIALRVPSGTDLTSLAPTYTTSPGTAGHPASGCAVDFTHPQVYTLTATDGSTKEYRVSVRPGLLYDFNDGTLQGWHNRVWDTALNAGQGGWTDLAADVTAMPPSINGGQLVPASDQNALFRNAGTCFLGPTSTFIVSGNHLDNHRNTLWLRSPEFRLDGSGDLTFELLAGTGAGTAPAAAAAVRFAAEDIDTTGWIGVCLHDVTTGEFVLSAHRSHRDFDLWQPLVFTADQLAKLPSTHTYTLDLLVTGTGIWSWVALDNVSIPGILVTATTTNRMGG